MKNYEQFLNENKLNDFIIQLFENDNINFDKEFSIRLYEKLNGNINEGITLGQIADALKIGFDKAKNYILNFIAGVVTYITNSQIKMYVKGIDLFKKLITFIFKTVGRFIKSPAFKIAIATFIIFIVVGMVTQVMAGNEGDEFKKEIVNAAIGYLDVGESSIREILANRGLPESSPDLFNKTANIEDIIKQAGALLDQLRDSGVQINQAKFDDPSFNAAKGVANACLTVTKDLMKDDPTTWQQLSEIGSTIQKLVSKNVLGKGIEILGSK